MGMGWIAESWIVGALFPSFLLFWSLVVILIVAAILMFKWAQKEPVKAAYFGVLLVGLASLLFLGQILFAAW